MDCNDVAKVAEAYNTVPPVCDHTNETEYAPKQCGFDGSLIFPYQEAFDF